MPVTYAVVVGWKRLRARVGSVEVPARVLKQRSGATEFFFREEPSAPLIVVVHISKTAGTALRRFVRSKLADTEVEVIQRLRYAFHNQRRHPEWSLDSLERLARERELPRRRRVREGEFEQHVGLLAHRYGWQKVLVPDAKVNPRRPSRPTVSVELRDCSG